MKARKFFSMFMIAAVICTTGFMMTSCQDEDDVMEVKYKNPEEKDPSDNLDKVSVSATSTYMTKDNYAIVLSYDAKLWETRVDEEKGVDEWTSFLKDVCEKVFKESVENVNWTDGKENFDNFMFGESGWGLYVANGFNGCIHESEMGVNYNCTFKIDEYPAEIVKNETHPVSIEEGTLFTCRNKTYGYPDVNKVWSMDWTGYCDLKVKTCEIKYSDNLEIVGDANAKDVLFEKVNLAVNNYIGGLVMKDLRVKSGERIDVFLDNVLIECEKHIKTLFNMENDNFEIVDFEIMKGALENYWITCCDKYGKTSGYDYKYIYNEYKAWKDNR